MHRKYDADFQIISRHVAEWMNNIISFLINVAYPDTGLQTTKMNSNIHTVYGASQYHRRRAVNVKNKNLHANSNKKCLSSLRSLFTLRTSFFSNDNCEITRNKVC